MLSIQYHFLFQTQLRKVGIRVFSYASKSNSLVLSIRKPGEKIGAETVKEMVGKVVHIEWPYMVEGLVTAISDKEKRFIYQQEERVVKEEKMTDVKMKDVQFWMDNVHKKYIERKGIDPGEIDVLVEAKLLKGTRYICGPKGKVTLEKEWADTHQFYPLQAVVQVCVDLILDFYVTSVFYLLVLVCLSVCLAFFFIDALHLFNKIYLFGFVFLLGDKFISLFCYIVSR